MTRISVKYVFVLLITTCICFAGCNQSNKPSGNTFGETAFQTDSSNSFASSDKPLILKLAVNDTYCEKTACACIHNIASREYDELINRLKSEYNIDLQLTYCIEEYDLEDSIKSQKFDGAICKPWLAFRHMKELGMTFTRIADVKDPFDNGLLGGIFIVKKDSPIQKPEDINGKVLVMGQEDSYEKYHMAMELMKKEGIKPKEIFHKSSCSECINMLLDNQAEVAVVSDYALTASCAVDFASEDAFLTILKTGDIPLCSVILNLNKVSEADAARLQNALLHLSGDKMPESFSSKGFVKPVSWIPTPFSESN